MIMINNAIIESFFLSQLNPYVDSFDTSLFNAVHRNIRNWSISSFVIFDGDNKV